MKSGLLIYDHSDQPLGAKIAAAAQRYYARFGVLPTAAYVNPRDLKAFATGRDPLTYKMPCAIRPNLAILPNHVWLGVDEAAPARIYAEIPRPTTQGRHEPDPVALENVAAGELVEGAAE